MYTCIIWPKTAISRQDEVVYDFFFFFFFSLSVREWSPERVLQRRRYWSGDRRERRSDTARSVAASNLTELTTAGIIMLHVYICEGECVCEWFK